MGAQLSTVAPTATVPIDAYVSELGDLAYAGDLGRSRFLKTVKAVHRDGVAAVKVFIKPTTAQIDIGPVKAQVKNISENLRHELGPLNEFPNAIGYSRIVETERAGYLVRQYIKHSLYDRISTRPFLEPIEKKWIAYQLLRALKSCHEHGIFHGDIKSENVLVGSWKWVYLADFAPFKPVRLPETDSAQFLFYFDVSQRRACYVAPERFTDQCPESLNAKMDIYSMGCVIAEFFLDGQPLFSLADLFKYKRGEYTPDLSSINDSSVRELIMSMVSVDPENRLSAAEYLDKYQNIIFPEYFDTYWHLLMPFSGSKGGASNSDEMIKHLWENFESEVLVKAMKLKDLKSASGKDLLSSTSSTTSPTSSSSSLPVVVTLPGIWWVPQRRSEDEFPTGDHGALMILSYVCSALTSTSSVYWRLRAAELILVLAGFVPDDAKLDRCLPYLVFLLRDSQPAVKTGALLFITHLMTMVSSYSPLNKKVYTAYLFPRLSQAITYNSPASMRAMYAECLPCIADLANRCEGWDSIIKFVEDATRFLLVDKVGIVRRSLLQNADLLCTVLHKQGTNDIILSHAITYLNDKDPLVRMDLFRFIAKVAPIVGPVSIEQYVVPLLVQSLCEPREDIVALILNSLAAIVEVGLLRLKTLLSVIVPSCVKFMIHPNTYCRTQVLLLMAATAKQLSKAQIYCLLRPLISPYLRSDVSDYCDHKALIEALRPPMSQSVYLLALQWASKAKKTAFWQPNSTSSAAVTFSQEDRRWLARLREVGFNNEDLWQLLAFRDYLWQLSLVLESPHATSQPSELDTNEIDEGIRESAPDNTEMPTTYHTRLTSERALASYRKGPVPRDLEVYVNSKKSTPEHKSAVSATLLIDSKLVRQPNAAENTGDSATSWASSRQSTPGTDLPIDRRNNTNNNGGTSSGNTSSNGSGSAGGKLVGAAGAKLSKFHLLDQSARLPSILVTSIKAHRGAIQVLKAHANGRLFITAADDGVVKLWDSRELLKGSSRPAITWTADSSATAGAFVGTTSVLILGTQSGKISFLDCKAKHNETGFLTFNSLSPIAEVSPTAAYGYPIDFHTTEGTLWVLYSSGVIQKIELATLKVEETLECPKEHGAALCWTWSPNEEWVAVGTLHGMINLFDTRFCLRVNSWGIGDLQPITALEYHPIKENCICLAGGFRRNLLSVWDVRKVECCELFVPTSDLDDDDDDDKLPSLTAIPATLESLNERFASWSLEETFKRPKPPITSLAASPLGGRHLLSGGGDKILRLWDVLSPHESSVISGTSYNRAKPQYMGKVGSSIKYTYEKITSGKSPGRLSRGTIIGLEEQDIGRNHRGTILKVALLQMPNARELAVSVDEVGVIKVFS